MNAFLKIAPHIARVLLGLMFFVFGLNGFLNFLPQPMPEGAAAHFLGGLGAAPYFFPLLKGTEVLIGVALLSNRLVPMALTILAPITINIAGYHLFLAPEGMLMVVVIAALQLYLMFAHKPAFEGLLRLKSVPPQQQLDHAELGQATA